MQSETLLLTDNLKIMIFVLLIVIQYLDYLG